MLSATPAAVSFQSDLLKMMDPLIRSGIVSRAKVESTYQSAMNTIKAEAGTGAKAGVKPLIIASLAASGVAAIIGLIAIAQARKTRKGS